MSRRSLLFRRRYAGLLKEEPEFLASKILADTNMKRVKALRLAQLLTGNPENRSLANSKVKAKT